MLDFDCNAGTSLRLLHDLHNIYQHGALHSGEDMERLTSMDLWLISRDVLAVGISTVSRCLEQTRSHLAQRNNLSLSCGRINLDDANRGAHSQCPINDVDTQDNGVALGEDVDDL